MAANIEKKVIEKLRGLKIEAIMRDVPDEVLASIPTEVKHD